MEVFEQSHLYVDEEAENDDDYEDEGYYLEEEGLEELVEECVEALGRCLADKQTDRVAREKIIEVLFAIYQQDLNADNSHDFAERCSGLISAIHAPLERQTLAARIVCPGQRRREGLWLLT